MGHTESRRDCRNTASASGRSWTNDFLDPTVGHEPEDGDGQIQAPAGGGVEECERDGRGVRKQGGFPLGVASDGPCPSGVRAVDGEESPHQNVVRECGEEEDGSIHGDRNGGGRVVAGPRRDERMPGSLRCFAGKMGILVTV